MASSKWYKVAKRNYEAGRWTVEMLRNVLQAGRITQAEYDEIVGGGEEPGEAS